MSELEVKIVRLEPMLVASAYGYGPSPENLAWEKMMKFVEAKGLATKNEPLGTYGFNNPNPSKGSPNYGYEIWLPVDAGVEPEGDMRILQFESGLYAVTQFKDLNKIGEMWRQLVRWRESSKYAQGHHQWLEELLTPGDVPVEEFIFNLYLPIVE